jgi:hypothetical protein
MKYQKWIIGPVVLSLALSATGISMAQPPTGGSETPKTSKQAKKNRAEKAQRNTKAARAVPLPSPQVLEKVLGKPLTDEQRKAVNDAAQSYLENIAKAVGLTPDQLKAQMQEYRATQRETKKQGGQSTGNADKDGATTPAGKDRDGDE